MFTEDTPYAISPRVIPPLDPHFRPLALACRAFRADTAVSHHEPLAQVPQFDANNS